MSTASLAINGSFPVGHLARCETPSTLKNMPKPNRKKVRMDLDDCSPDCRQSAPDAARGGSGNVIPAKALKHPRSTGSRIFDNIRAFPSGNGFDQEWEVQGCVQTFRESVCLDDLMSAGKAVFGSEKLDKAKYLISDLTNTQSMALTESEIKMVVYFDRVSASYKGRFMHVIVGEHPLLEKAVDMYVAKFSGTEWIHIHRKTMDEARRAVHSYLLGQ